MANPELYRNVITRTVPCKPIRKVGGFHPAATYSSIIFRDEEEYVSLVLGYAETDQEKENPLLAQVSSYHGRSYEQVGSRGFWSDRFGNCYSVVSSKGNRYDDPRAYMADNYPSGFYVYGLQFDDTLERILRSSLMLRRNRVVAEAVRVIKEPTRLIIDGIGLSVADFKYNIVLDAIAAAKVAPPQSKRNGSHQVTLEKVLS